MFGLRTAVRNRNWYVMSSLRVAVVVDVDLVEDVVAELEEVRPAGRLLERDVVGDDRDRVRAGRGSRTRRRRCCRPRGSPLISGASRWLEARVGSIQKPANDHGEQKQHRFFHAGPPAAPGRHRNWD